MKFPDRETVERLRGEFPAGTRVVLLKMEDAQAPAPGTLGTVRRVDDSGGFMSAGTKAAVWGLFSGRTSAGLRMRSVRTDLKSYQRIVRYTE